MNIDDLFADDVKKKTEGANVSIPGIPGGFLVLKSFNAAVFNEALKRKAESFEDRENPTDKESRLAVCQIYVEEFISGWGGIKEEGKELEDTQAERLRVFCDPKYERLIDFAIAEMSNIENYRYREKEKAKKP